MTRIKRFVDGHLDLTAILGFVVLVLLMRVVLDSTTNLTLTLLASTALVVVVSLFTRIKTAPDS
jgi:ABC-type arginine transport system permease subunit